MEKKLDISKNKNVIILGKGNLAIKICDWFKNSSDYNLILVVPVIPEPKWTNSLRDWCENNSINYIPSGNYKDINMNLKIDLAFSVFYDKIIKKDFINKCDRILNLHNSPLPLYRGVSPINWALKDEREEHGITIHEITEGIDDGPIISQIKYSIYPEFEEVKDVYKKSIGYGYELFIATIPILDKIVAKKQEGTIIYHDSNENKFLGNRMGWTRHVSDNKITKTKLKKYK